jgi:hypothetical protein
MVKATVHYRKEVKGTLVTHAQWLELTANDLRRAIAAGDLLVVRQEDGTHVAVPPLECSDDIEYGGGDYFRPSVHVG